MIFLIAKKKKRTNTLRKFPDKYIFSLSDHIFKKLTMQSWFLKGCGIVLCSVMTRGISSQKEITSRLEEVS